VKEQLKRFPFDPARWPFFYGWMILAFGTLGMLMSVPGQTVGVSVFTDFLIDAHDLPRKYLSLAYLIGTTTSALLLTRAGRFYDRFGARMMGVLVSVGLGLVLIYLSFSELISEALHSVLPFLGGVVSSFIVMSFGFFLLRFMGQGSLTLVSRNVVMEWFEKRRGLANGVLGVAVSFGFSYSPRVLDDLIGVSGWQDAWRFLALIVGGGFAFLAFLFFRDQPEDHDLIPDGREIVESKHNHPETRAARQFSLPEARSTFTFWVFTLSLLMSALIVTAFTFHVVSVFETNGLIREQAVAIFFPSSIVAVAVQFLSSWSSDYIKLKYLLMLQLVGMVILCLGMITLHEGFPVILIITGNGITQGLMGVTGNITWARFYGREHLGAISGFAAAWSVGGSAVGPYLFSLSLDWAGSYASAALISLVVVGVLFIASFKAERPE
jgi:sugar phosphate permease